MTSNRNFRFGTSFLRAAHQRRKLKRTEEVESKRRDYDYQVKGAVDRFYMMALSNRGLGKVDFFAFEALAMDQSL